MNAVVSLHPTDIEQSSATPPRALLPENYRTAVRALRECDRIDECKDWSDRAAALASYAKQAQDGALFYYARRIQARAVRRCGELLRQVPSAQGARTDQLREGDRPKFGREAAADAAELSEHQRKQALRVANVPAEAFERQIESDNPPSVTALAEQGKVPAQPTAEEREIELEAREVLRRSLGLPRYQPLPGQNLSREGMAMGGKRGLTAAQALEEGCWRDIWAHFDQLQRLRAEIDRAALPQSASWAAELDAAGEIRNVLTYLRARINGELRTD